MIYTEEKQRMKYRMVKNRILVPDLERVTQELLRINLDTYLTLNVAVYTTSLKTCMSMKNKHK
jgi:hypothetical protein